MRAERDRPGALPTERNEVEAVRVQLDAAPASERGRDQGRQQGGKDEAQSLHR
jgi:hypothetical protein